MSVRYAAFFDLDGTLAVRNQPPLSVDVEAMRTFRAKGNLLFLCTGRATGYLYDAITDIGFDGIVAGAGAYVSVGDTMLYHASVSNALLAPLQRMFEQSTSTLVMETERCMVQLASPAAKKLVPAYPRIFTADEWMQQYPDEITSKLTVYGHLPEKAIPFVQQHLDIIDHGHYEEVIPKGCSKSDGVRRVLEHVGISREHSIGFGDSMNDYDMLQYVGIGVAMGNATDRVKEIADRITAPFNEGGIAQALKEWME